MNSFSQGTFETYMSLALDQANIALSRNEVPIGSVVVDLNSEAVIASAYNETETTCDPSAHAEVLAIRRAAQSKNNWRLQDCALFVTVEPCTMCAGLILQSRIPLVVFGCSEPLTGAVGSQYDLLGSSDVRVVRGISETKCRKTLQTFFNIQRRK